MPQDPGRIIVPANAKVHTKTFDGSGIPTQEDTPLVGYSELGYVSTDGVTFNPTQDTLEVMADQSRYAVLHRIISVNAELTCNLLEVSQATLLASFGGGEFVEVSAGHFAYRPPVEGELWEASVVYDFEHTYGGDTYQYRLALKRVTTATLATPQFSSRSNTQLALALKILDPLDGSGVPFEYLSNDPAFDPASVS